MKNVIAQISFKGLLSKASGKLARSEATRQLLPKRFADVFVPYSACLVSVFVSASVSVCLLIPFCVFGIHPAVSESTQHTAGVTVEVDRLKHISPLASVFGIHPACLHLCRHVCDQAQRLAHITR